MIEFFIGTTPLMLLCAYLLCNVFVSFDKPEATKKEQFAVFFVLWIVSELFLVGFLLECLCVGTAWSIPNLFMRIAVILTEIFLFYFVAKAVVKITNVLIKFIFKISH